MNARTILLLSLVAFSVAATGCGRYSYRIRSDVDAGRYSVATSRCENDSWAASSQWNPQHQARYHVYCGLAFLNVGDTQRAQSHLVRAEKMRLDNPSLIRGRDLTKLSAGLMQLFGVPAGQLEIEVRPGTEVAQAGDASEPAAPAPPVTVVPPAPVTNAPSVSFTAGVSTSVHPPVIEIPAAPEPPEDATEDDDGRAEPEPPAPPPAPPAQPPVIVIPEEDAAVIQ